MDKCQELGSSRICTVVDYLIISRTIKMDRNFDPPGRQPMAAQLILVHLSCRKERSTRDKFVDHVAVKKDQLWVVPVGTINYPFYSSWVNYSCALCTKVFIVHHSSSNRVCVYTILNWINKFDYSPLHRHNQTGQNRVHRKRAALHVFSTVH